MMSLISKIFGGNKSEKDVKKITPLVARINDFFNQYQSLSNDQLRSKTTEFRNRIKEHLNAIDEQINSKKEAAENLSSENITKRIHSIMKLMHLKKTGTNKLKRC